MNTHNARFIEYIGRLFSEVEQQLISDNEFAVVVSVPDDSFVTADFRLDRIRIYYDRQNEMVSSVVVG